MLFDLISLEHLYRRSLSNRIDIAAGWIIGLGPSLAALGLFAAISLSNPRLTSCAANESAVAGPGAWEQAPLPGSMTEPTGKVGFLSLDALKAAPIASGMTTTLSGYIVSHPALPGPLTVSRDGT